MFHSDLCLERRERNGNTHETKRLSLNFTFASSDFTISIRNMWIFAERKTMKNKTIIDAYEPCLCGSGEKYKFCCYLKKDIHFRNSDEARCFLKKHKKKLEFCLHEGSDCSGKIIKSHSIQNNKILSKLAVEGHVYCVGYDADSFAGIDLKKRGRNDATTSTCFCQKHDTEIFKNIERKKYEYSDEQNFLYAYRAFSKAYYDKLEELATQQCLFESCHQQFIESEQVERLRGSILGTHDNEEIKALFNSALDQSDYDAVETVAASLDYEIKFATSFMCPLSYDLRGNLINDVYSLKDSMKNIFVNIFPENGNTYILISWLKIDSNAYEQFKEQFIELQKDRSQFINALNNMVACQSDNFAISPELVDSWDKSTKQFFVTEFLSFMFSSSRAGRYIGEEIEKDLIDFSCKFDLFN